MMSGWVKHYRKMINWEWRTCPKTYSVFCYCLESASHNEYKWRGEQLNPGEFPTSYEKISEVTGVTYKSVRTVIKRLIRADQLAKRASRQGTIITVKNWNEYQNRADERAAEGQRRGSGGATTKNVKNVKNNIYSPADDIPYRDIVNYLNDKTGKNYKDSTDKTKRLIKARWNEGFRLGDFKAAISQCSEDWRGNPDMSRYLRPETIFGNKMEGYAQSKKKKDSLEEFFLKNTGDTDD